LSSSASAQSLSAILTQVSRKARVPAASGALAASWSGAHICSISPIRAPISMARSTDKFQT
jgi:hypothetical protein